MVFHHPAIIIGPVNRPEAYTLPDVVDRNRFEFDDTASLLHPPRNARSEFPSGSSLWTTPLEASSAL